MSETATATAETVEGQAPAEAAPSTQAEGQNSTDEKRQVAGLYISTPEILRAKIDEEAAKVGKTSRVFVRDFLASQWGLTLPEPRTRSVYKSDEEREAAQLAKRKARADLIKQLLAEHRAKQQQQSASTPAA